MRISSLVSLIILCSKDTLIYKHTWFIKSVINLLLIYHACGSHALYQHYWISMASLLSTGYRVSHLVFNWHLKHASSTPSRWRRSWDLFKQTHWGVGNFWSKSQDPWQGLPEEYPTHDTAGPARGWDRAGWRLKCTNPSAWDEAVCQTLRLNSRTTHSCLENEPLQSEWRKHIYYCSRWHVSNFAGINLNKGQK